MVFEDSFLMIHEIDGKDAADELRDRMTDFDDSVSPDYQFLQP